MTAVDVGDRARYLLPAMGRRVESALSLISEAATRGRLGVSVSTGKDSLVVLDLVRRVIPDAPAGYYDSGTETEYNWNREFCKRYDVEIVTSEIPLADLCRDYGYWGHEADKYHAEVNWFAFLVGEPAFRFIERHDLGVTALGLRAQESGGRRMNRHKKGLLYTVDTVPGRPNYTHVTPIADWSHDDVWAYIAGRKLWYNPAYDLMADAGIPRNEWRVSVLLGSSASNIGRYARLRQIAPEKFAALAAHFPDIRRFT